jgi:hypothetical protein
MTASKRDKNLKRIQEFKERFENDTTEKLRMRLTHGVVKEAAIACRQLLIERGIDSDVIDRKSL